MTAKNPALVRLVASRYRELQGLRTAASAGILIAGALGSWAGVWTERKATSLVLLAAYAWWYFARLRGQIDAYYANRFGRVGTRAHSLSVMLWLVLGPVLGFVATDAGTPARLIGDLLLILMAGPSVWIAIRDRPFRTHWLLVTAVGVLAALQFPQVRSAHLAWEARMWFEAGLAIAFAGFCDHLILARNLAGVPGEDVVVEEPAR